MRAVLLNGSRTDNSVVDEMAISVGETLVKQGLNVTSYTLRDHKIGYCIGCFGCWTKSPGECVIKDDNREIAEDIIQGDLLVFVTPIVFGGYSAELKRMVDHLIPLISPFFRKLHTETHHRMRYSHYPNLLAVGSLPAPDPRQESIFHELVRRNAISLGDAESRSLVWYESDTLATIDELMHDELEVLR
ncbi:MAG: flavodoxin family protein [Chloroflexota bacterium]